LEAVKSLALTDAEINRLKTEPLISQLECHREIKKRRVTVDSGNRDGSALEHMSHMKNKAQREESSGQKGRTIYMTRIMMIYGFINTILDGGNLSRIAETIWLPHPFADQAPVI
jgi:hypothetical protein